VADGERAVSEAVDAGHIDEGGARGAEPEAPAPQPSRQWQSDFDALPAGRHSPVRTAGSSEELRAYFDRWTDGAEAQPARGPKIPEVYRLADGTIIQWRLSSRSGGETVDIFRAGERDRKVHLE
jgi:hypothetical protein